MYTRLACNHGQYARCSRAQGAPTHQPDTLDDIIARRPPDSTSHSAKLERDLASRPA